MWWQRVSVYQLNKRPEAGSLLLPLRYRESASEMMSLFLVWRFQVTVFYWTAPRRETRFDPWCSCCMLHCIWFFHTLCSNSIILYLYIFWKRRFTFVYLCFFFSMSRGRCPLSCACDPVPSWPCDVFSPDLKMGKYTKDTWHYWLLKVCVFVCRMGVWFRCQAYDTSPYPLTQNPEIISMYPFDTLLSKVT